MALGVVTGLLSAAAGVGASMLVARVIGNAPTPVDAVGSRIIDATPRPVKEWAVQTLGTADKSVLLAGIAIVLAAFACATGILAWRSRPAALGITVVLGLVGVAAAYAEQTRLLSPVGRVTPALTALVVSTVLFAWFTAGWSDHPSISPAPAPTFDRRAFLAATAVSGAVAVIGALSSPAFSSVGVRSRNRLQLPRPDKAAAPVPADATLHVPGITPYITRNADFYRVDTALSVPQLAASDWRLRIHGLVDSDITLSFAELLSMPLVERRITLTCVSNEVGGDLAGNATWLGVRTADVLGRAGVKGTADAVKSTSIDGFTAGTPLPALTDDRDALIAIGMNGQPLPLEHGFPARLVVPGLYGYVSATKWLVDMEVTRFADFTAYWTTRGWSREAPIKTESRIDVPTGSTPVKAGRVAVAGVAWAQHTGIAAVHVRVDGGPWQAARLAAEDNIDTWRQWVYEWDAPRGQHTLQVRATDNSGYTQTSRRQPPPPNGATGWHTVQVTVT
jgi:DMSO/TMAO reductase YedYZ molybdopterin-dependent catalytic subunit